LKRCWYAVNDEKCNKYLNNISTQLTAYHHHYK
jgi:hypothetical protein